MKISGESIDKIRREADIVKVVGHYVSMKEKGINYIAYCPFHLESIPLFIVSPDHQIYKCYGCGQSGDSVKFMMDYFGLSYGDALLKLVRKFKIKISEDEKTELNKQYSWEQ